MTYHKPRARVPAIKLKLHHPDTGERFTWTVKRDPVLRLWILTDHNRYDRVLESTWVESLPRIRMIVENHGCTLLTPIS